MNKYKPPWRRNFDIFWRAYPRKVGRADAMEVWKEKHPPLDDVLRALKWQKACPDWLADNGAYIPSPDRYLRSNRWKDKPVEIPSVRGLTMKLQPLDVRVDDWYSAGNKGTLLDALLDVGTKEELDAYRRQLREWAIKQGTTRKADIKL